MNREYPHNPLLPDHVFVPDAEAHVWADGRLYLYGSFDMQGNRAYCSREYHVYSTDDLEHWTDHGVSFTLADAAWYPSDKPGCHALYAPDCAYRNGVYYLYYCVPDGRCGVASSPSPAGPFTDIGPIEGVMGIDPAVLIDDDRQAYLYWGQFDNVRAAKLKDNMTEIEPDSVVQPLSVAEHDFHEGSSVKKIGGLYYFLYTDTHRHKDAKHPIGKATCLGYAVSDKPTSGFRYGGIIIDNEGCDPGTWNDHGSLCCFHGQWYVFYHRSTHGGEFSRHVCAEPVTIENGVIAEVPMTSSGAAPAIPASARVRAAHACLLSGNVRSEGDDTEDSRPLVLGQIRPGDSAVFRYLSFDGENRFSADIRSDKNCTISVYLDDICCGVADGSGSASFAEGLTGVHTLRLVFGGDFSDAQLRSFRFFRK